MKVRWSKPAVSDLNEIIIHEVHNNAKMRRHFTVD